MPSGVLLPALVTVAVVGLTVYEGIRRRCRRQKQKAAAGRGEGSEFYDTMGRLLNWPNTSLWFNWGLWGPASTSEFPAAASALCAVVHGCVHPDTETIIGT